MARRETAAKGSNEAYAKACVVGHTVYVKGETRAQVHGIVERIRMVNVGAVER